MVFENLTLFEFHLEDAQFGPTTIGDDAETLAESNDHVVEHDDESSGGPSRLRIGFMAVVTAVVVATLARRLAARKGDAEAPSIEFEDETDDPVEIEA